MKTSHVSVALCAALAALPLGCALQPSEAQPEKDVQAQTAVPAAGAPGAAEQETEDDAYDESDEIESPMSPEDEQAAQLEEQEEQETNAAAEEPMIRGDRRYYPGFFHHHFRPWRFRRPFFFPGYFHHHHHRGCGWYGCW